MRKHPRDLFLFFAAFLSCLIATPPRTHADEPKPPAKDAILDVKEGQKVLLLGNVPTPFSLLIDERRDRWAVSFDKVLETDATIVIGRITKTARVAPDLTDSAFDGRWSWVGNYTVYAVTVERYLRGKGPQRIQIWMPGGRIAEINDTSGQVRMPRVGERFIISLKPPLNSSTPWSITHIRFRGQVTPLEPRDARPVVRGPYAMILLTPDGNAYPSYKYLAESPTEANTDPPSFGRTEADAVAAMEKAIAARAAMERALHGP